ncbi:family 43 glycosylhydrolase [Arthrobacter sp. Z1-9]
MMQHTNARNPVLPLDFHLPDCEAHVMPDGRLYLYGSYDNSEQRYCSNEYRVVSTPDMNTWTIHDVAFRAEDADWASSSTSEGKSFLDGASSYDDLPAYAKKMIPPETMSVPFDQFAAEVREHTKQRQPEGTLLYAPDAIEKNGKYYLYMCLSDNTEGVAVADNPEGPFRHATQLPVTGIDPAVFIDDDGRAYYYWGQFSASAARLNPDMISLDTASTVKDLATEETHHFHEGSSVRKREHTYYFVFADTSRGKPTSLGYATSAFPLGPFTYRGVIIDNAGCDPGAWNIHGSIEDFNGQWYVFYHRNSRNVSSMRRLCIEPIEFADDGNIPEVKMTSQGAGAAFQPAEVIPAYAACGVTGGSYIAPFEGTEALFNSGPGSALFRYVENSQPLKTLRFRAQGSGELDLLIDGKFAATADLAAGQIQVTIPPGIHEVELVFRTDPGATFVEMSFEKESTEEQSWPEG